MDIESELIKLYNSRLLKTSDEIEQFENAINNIMSLNDATLIPEMCKAFDDNTEDREVMYGLVHAIETFDGEEYFIGILKAFPYMVDNAKKWLKTLHYGILNDPPSRKMYAKVLSSKTEQQCVRMVINFLNEIKLEKPRFADLIDEIIKAVSL